MRASRMDQYVKNLPVIQETQEMWVRSPGLKDSMKEKNGNPF